MRRRLATPAALAVLMLSLTACAGDDGTGPITEAPSYPNQGSDDGSETPEESDGGGDDEGDEQAASDIPAPDPADYPGMDENTPEGAEQFTRYFAATMFWGYQTGDASTFEETFGADCEVCSENAELISMHGMNGEAWSPITLEDTDIAQQGANDVYDQVVAYSTLVSAHEEPDPDTDEIRDVGVERYAFGAGLNWTSTGWVVEDVHLDIHAQEN